MFLYSYYYIRIRWLSRALQCDDSTTAPLHPPLAHSLPAFHCMETMQPAGTARTRTVDGPSQNAPAHAPLSLDRTPPAKPRTHHGQP